MTHLLSWHWRSLGLKDLTGSEVFDRLYAFDTTIATLLTYLVILFVRENLVLLTENLNYGLPN